MGTLFTEHPRKVDSLVVAVQHLPGVHHLPYSRKDFDVEDALSSELKSIVQDLDLSAVSTLKHLGLEGSDLRRQSFEVSKKIRRHPLHQINQIELQRNIYLSFTKKNFAWILDELANVPGAQVMLESVVTKLNLEDHADDTFKSVNSIIIQTRNGDHHSITARAVLICQGAIETTRTLLEIAHQQGDDFISNGKILLEMDLVITSHFQLPTMIQIAPKKLRRSLPLHSWKDPSRA
jgi:hypothetical protein